MARKSKNSKAKTRSGTGVRKGGQRSYILRKKRCRFCAEGSPKIEYTDYQLLRRFTTERGKIIPSRISGTCAKHQRKIANAIKRARNIGLLPYAAE